MANNQSIQFLRGTAARKAEVGNSTKLLAGQPFFEKDTNKLYVGDGEKNLDALAAINGSYYDTVISNQAEFETWCNQLNAGSYTGHSVLFLEGTYKKQGTEPIEIPEGPFVICGSGKVLITANYDYSAQTPGVIRYSGTASNADHRIVNITAHVVDDAGVFFYGIHNLINCTVTYAGYTGFSNCEHLLNCTVMSHHMGAGFDHCNYLTNCSCISSDLDPQGVGFSMCSNLVDCTVTGGLQPVAFSECSNLVGCIGEANNYQGQGYAFQNCKGLTNCSGKAAGMGTSYVFYGGSIFSNCWVSEPLDPYNSRKKAWGGSSTAVCTETCPEYSLE